MNTILADCAVSLAEFKQNPAAALRAANHQPLAVLNGDEVAFYALAPEVMEALLDELDDAGLRERVWVRLAKRETAVGADIDTV